MSDFFFCVVLTLLKVEQPELLPIKAKRAGVFKQTTSKQIFVSSESDYHHFYHLKSLEMLQDEGAGVAASLRSGRTKIDIRSDWKKKQGRHWTIKAPTWLQSYTMLKLII